MITAGRHRARAVEAALGYTNGGKEQVAVLFELADGDEAGQQITWYGYFTERTEERTLESLRYCGWEGDDISNLGSVTKNDVQIVVEMERSDDGHYARVRWVNRSGTALALKSHMNDEQKRAFAARMKGKAMTMRQASGQQKPDGTRAPQKSELRVANSAVNDDGIPF